MHSLQSTSKQINREVEGLLLDIQSHIHLLHSYLRQTKPQKMHPADPKTIVTTFLTDQIKSTSTNAEKQSFGVLVSALIVIRLPKLSTLRVTMMMDGNESWIERMLFSN